MNIKVDIYLILSILILCFFHQAQPFLIFYFLVILHELAHILMAISLKIKLEEISFLPFGVNAKFEFEGQRKKEIVIALAGPIFSLGMAFLFPQYKIQNLFIAIINLLPIYPLDGGRILKNGMILKWGITRASNIYQQIVRTFIILLMIINIVLLVFQKNYRFLFVSFYIIQLAGEEIKKDKIRIQMKELLNLDI